MLLDMTTGAWGSLGVFALFAALDWLGRARDDRRLELAAKPLATIALIALAVAVEPDDPTRRAWFVAALVLSLAGDVLLLDEDRFFVFGLAAFLVAHICYIGGLWSDPPGVVAFAVAAAVTLTAVLPVARRVVPAARAADRGLAAPVGLYVAVISVMVASAGASGRVTAAAGAALFAFSDSLIAWNRFVRRVPMAGLVIMVTYHLGQLGLVLSLVR
jgi:uncharacterized membrane protein YhhN